MANKSISSPTKIGFEQKYSDGSGIEFAVHFDALADQREIVIKSGPDQVELPRDQFDWLLACLMKIASEVTQ